MWKRLGFFELICHRFLRPTCLQLGPNLAPKVHQNRVMEASWGALGRLRCILERRGGLLGRLGRVLGRLGRILDRLGGVLEASWSVLGASWGVLNLFPFVLKRKKSERGPKGVQSRSSARPLGTPQLSKTKNSTAGRQHSTPLQTTFQRTQTRSWAPSGPVRIQNSAELRTCHRA